jgi:hypothetical protein
MRITKAQPIRPYHGPQYLVQPVGPAADQEELDAINQAPDAIIAAGLLGWGPYPAIVRVRREHDAADYLVATGD